MDTCARIAKSLVDHRGVVHTEEWNTELGGFSPDRILELFHGQQERRIVPHTPLDRSHAVDYRRVVALEELAETWK